MGMEFLSRLPDLVVEDPLRPPSRRQGLSSLSIYGEWNRTIVAALIWQSRSSIEALIGCSP